MHLYQGRRGGGWCARWGSGREGPKDVLARRAPLSAQASLCPILRERDAACGEAAIVLRPGRPALRPGGARRPPSRPRRPAPGNAAKHAHGT
eukprot:5409283-Pleurochrysis_carterae.AAC.1